MAHVKLEIREKAHISTKHSINIGFWLLKHEWRNSPLPIPRKLGTWEFYTAERQTKAKHTQFALGSLGQFVTAEGLENMTTTPETSPEVNAGPHYACTACAKQTSYSLAPKAALVQPNQGKTHVIRTWLSRAICYCRGPRKHDDDTGDVARSQRWSTPTIWTSIDQ